MEKSYLTEEHLKKLEEYGIFNMNRENGVYLKYHAGETMLEQGMPMEHIFIVLKGRAKVRISNSAGKALILCYYISGGIIGDIELMTGTYTASATITTITDFECIGLPYQRCAETLKENNAFLNKIGREISLKLLQSSQKYVESTLYTGEERLCNYLLENSYHDIFCEPLTDVASSIGTSYRHLLRMIKELCEEELLVKSENGYRITDRKRLEERQK